MFSQPVSWMFLYSSTLVYALIWMGFDLRKEEKGFPLKNGGLNEAEKHSRSLFFKYSTTSIAHLLSAILELHTKSSRSWYSGGKSSENEEVPSKMEKASQSELTPFTRATCLPYQPTRIVASDLGLLSFWVVYFNQPLFLLKPHTR